MSRCSILYSAVLKAAKGRNLRKRKEKKTTKQSKKQNKTKQNKQRGERKKNQNYKILRESQKRQIRLTLIMDVCRTWSAEKYLLNETSKKKKKKQEPQQKSELSECF